jgi:hypothetical protein
MRAPRTLSSRRSLQPARSVPERRTAPDSMRPPEGSSPSTALEVVVLPDPDSPTSATTSPGCTSKETSCTTRRDPAELR